MAKSKEKEQTVRTAFGDEKLVTVRVKSLSVPWTIYEPSPLREGEFIAKESRAVQGDVIDVPESVYEKYADPSIDAWYKEEEVAEDSVTDEGDVTPLGQMSQADLDQWYADNKPKVKDVLEAAEGDPDLASRLLNSENNATNNDPRDGVVEGLSAIIAKG